MNATQRVEHVETVGLALKETTVNDVNLMWTTELIANSVTPVSMDLECLISMDVKVTLYDSRR